MKFNELFAREGLTMERLRALVLIDEAGSIAGAAPENRSQQSQLSRQLTELELFFNVALKRIEGRTVRLTPIGHKLAQVARENLQSLADFLRALEQAPTEVLLGAGDSLHQWLVLPKFAQLQRLKPSAIWHSRTLSNAAMSRQLDDGQLDFALMRTEFVKGRLQGEPAGRINYSLVVPEALCPHHSKPTLREALADLPLAVQNDTTQFQQSLNTAIAKRSWKLNVKLHSESFPQVAQAVTSNAVAGVLPDLAARTFDHGRYWTIPLAELSELSRGISLAWNPYHLAKHTWMRTIRASLHKTLQFEGTERSAYAQR